MYIKRFLEEKVRKYLNRKEIIAIVGPRQSGKTTMMKEIFKDLKNSFLIDFEDHESLELFDSDIKSFIELYVKDHDSVFFPKLQVFNVLIQ